MIFVALLAMDWGLPCTIQAVDVAAVARQRRLSLEETARQVRYGFLADVARRVGASTVAVGHHADDQSETVLMHLLRGTGLAGLRGMLPVVDLNSLRVIRDFPVAAPSAPHLQLVRPLLSVRRIEIEAYCRAHDLSPRFDRSNLDTSYFRNRLRHELLPLLETYNPNIRTLLRRTANVAAADYELLTTVLQDAWARHVREEREDTISFDLAGWRALPLALQRAILRCAAFRLRPQLRDVDFVHIEQAVSIASNGSTGAQATLPQGLRLTVDYDTLRLAGTDQILPMPDWPLLWDDERIPVAIPGQTVLPGNPPSTPTLDWAETAGDTGGSLTWSLEACPWEGERDTVGNNPDRWTAYLDADKLGSKLTLRRRRPGDRFQPLGMGGQVARIADLMINAKIPRRWREHIPLLVHSPPGRAREEEIAWLVGWRIDQRVRITAKTRRMVRLRWLRTPTSEVSEA